MEWVEHFEVRRRSPLRFGVLLGDCVHIAAVLDHLAWQATILDGGTPNNATQFPIVRKSEAAFEKAADRQIRTSVRRTASS